MTEKKAQETASEGQAAPTTSIVKRDPMSPAPVSFMEIQSMGDVFFKSGMFADLKSAAQAIVKIQAGRELGLPPVYSMQRLYMVDGKLGMAAETMLALLKSYKNGKYNYRVKEHTDKKCSLTFYEDGQEVYVSTFSLEDARRARLIKPNGAWEKYPRALLFSRAASQGVRIVAPDAVGGGYTLEELQGIVEEKGETTMIPKVTVTEGVNESPQSPQGLDGTSEGSPEGEGAGLDDGSEGEVNPYLYLLEKCPEHGVAWLTNRFGKLFHKDGSNFCNFQSNEQIKVILKARATLAEMDAEAVNDWCKKKFGGTWSQIKNEEQVEVLWDLDKITEKKENPIVKAALEEGAVITPEKKAKK